MPLDEHGFCELTDEELTHASGGCRRSSSRSRMSDDGGSWERSVTITHRARRDDDDVFVIVTRPRLT